MEAEDVQVEAGAVVSAAVVLAVEEVGPEAQGEAVEVKVAPVVQEEAAAKVVQVAPLAAREALAAQQPEDAVVWEPQAVTTGP